MDGLIYIVAVIAIVVMVLYLVFKLKGKGNENNTVSTPTIKNENYSGVRKGVAIQSFGNQKLNVIKCVREHTGLGLKDAKDVVECNGTIEALPIEVAQALIAELNELGASAELK